MRNHRHMGMQSKSKRKRVFPKLTRVEISENNLGYYLKQEGGGEVLDITFKNPSDAIQHAISEHWIIVVADEVNKF